MAAAARLAAAVLAAAALGGARAAALEAEGSVESNASRHDNASAHAELLGEHGGALENATGWCRHAPYHAFAEYLTEVRGVEDPHETIIDVCNEICLLPSAQDYLRECQDHQHHGAYKQWQEAMTEQPSLQWNILFVIISLLSGAFILKCFPSQIPYTVGILVVFCALGLIAESLATAAECPHHAWVFADEHEVTVDGHTRHVTAVSREGWDLFTGVGFHSESFCIQGAPSGRSFSKRRSCGDGSEHPPDCMDFDSLDVPFKLSSMLPESVANVHEEYLSADQLWTVRCNLLRDILGLSDINPHQLLVIFLPALLFESACFGIDMGIFKKQVVQILALAFPAMVVASLVTGVLVWACFANWTFWVCLLIGVILSATDPVAVVALLKELGASKELGTQIEGESLLNDGSAYVLFIWVRNCIGYPSSVLPPGWMLVNDDYERFGGCIGCELLRVVAQLCFFGVLFGLAFGFVTVSCTRFLYNQQMIEGPIVLAMSYLCFWMAELITGASAVIAVVVMGLYCNVNKSGISAEVFHFLHQFYGMCAHILNTVIFAILGTKLGLLVVDGSFEVLWEVYWWQILMIYPIVLFARAFTLAVFFPLLQRTGTGCTWQEAVVMWWGGLRGTIGLALAIQILELQYDVNMWGAGADYVEFGDGKQTISLHCRDQPSTVILMTVVVVTLTVIINGVTIAPLMRWLKVTEVTDARKMMLNGSFSKLRQLTEHVTKQLRGEPTFFKEVNWKKVLDPRNGLDLRVFHHDIADVPKAAWLSVLKIERASYARQYECGELTREGFAVLENFMATLTARAPAVPAARLTALYADEFRKILKRLSLAPSKATFYSRILAYQVAKAYIKAQLDVKHSMQLHKVDLAHKPEDGTDEEKERIQSARQGAVDAMTAVEKEHLEVIDQMHELLAMASDFSSSADDPKVDKAHHKYSAYKSRYASKLLLLEQRHAVEQLVHEGLLDELDAAPLVKIINKKIGKTELAPLIARIVRRVEPLAPEWLLQRAWSPSLMLQSELSRGRGEIRKVVRRVSPRKVPRPNEHV